jgi:hypothetical protein
MALGPRDMQSLVILDGWDATELQNFRLKDGTTYAAVVGQINAALGALSSEFYSHPLYNALVSYTDQPTAEYRQGASNGMTRFTEYTRPDPQRADVTGHMIPLYDYDRALAWTWKYLKNARMGQIEADIADAVKDVRDNYRKQILTRLLKRGDDSVGTTGESPGFATAAASTGVDFTPPAFGGTSFDSNHEHYIGITGGAPTLAVFQDAKEELREHGHEPSYEFIIGSAHEAATRALTGFVPAVSSNSMIEYGALQDRVRFSDDSVTVGVHPIGMLEDFRIWVVRGMPQYYGFGWKSYGPNSQRNPLLIRLDEGQTRPFVLGMPDPRAGNATTPIQYFMFYTEFGVGVNDRTNGTPRYFNSATWADGTPT